MAGCSRAAHFPHFCTQVQRSFEVAMTVTADRVTSRLVRQHPQRRRERLDETGS
jgi:hypothetical protein